MDDVILADMDALAAFLKREFDHVADVRSVDQIMADNVGAFARITGLDGRFAGIQVDEIPFDKQHLAMFLALAAER